jgi:hypothetical protein
MAGASPAKQRVRASWHVLCLAGAAELLLVVVVVVVVVG